MPRVRALVGAVAEPMAKVTTARPVRVVLNGRDPETVGAAVTALDETRKLPQTIIAYPMTVASQVAQLVMKMQQDVADLVNRGDETLGHLFPPKDEQPEWATFDEDLYENLGDEDDVPAGRADGERLTEGRYALYSTGEPDAGASEATGKVGAGASEATGRNAAGASEATGGNGAGAPTADPTPTVVPDVVAELDYSTLTLAQLRQRLTSLKLADLEALLVYEGETKARAPFQTLLDNRITRATAK